MALPRADGEVVIEPQWAAVPLRIVLGAGLLLHALPEVAAGGSLGMLAALEAFGGVAIVVGLLVRPMALLGVVDRLLQVLSLGDGSELDLLYVAGFLALYATGAGPLALETWLAGDEPRPRNPGVAELERP